MGAAIRFAVATVLVSAVLAVGGCLSRPDRPPDRPGGADSKVLPRTVAARALDAFKNRNGQKLSALVHPIKGVRFSPYSYVDVDNDVVLTRGEAVAFWDDSESYTWGAADGSGEPIRMTPAEYVERYVVDRDFDEATTVSTDADRVVGNTVNNAASAYPDGVRIEYYVESTSFDGETADDWAALRLVAEEFEGSWYLVGVIHDEWTI